MTSCLPRCDVLTSWAFLLSLQEQEWGGRYTRLFLAVARVWLARLDAVDILSKRFGDQTQIKAKHMDALMSLEPVKSSETYCIETPT